MSLQLHTTPCSDGREEPSLTGFRSVDGDWQLDVSYYKPFIKDVTGVELVGTPSQRELKLIQSRLEGCLEAYGRRGNCACRDFEQYPHIDSRETVHELARFFRILVAVEVENTDLTH